MYIYIYIYIYILVSGTIAPQAGDNPNNIDKVLFKNWAPVTDCIIEINNT